ncbi:MAG: M61 family metallopeptidase, partial [Candidatus Eremiobacteraeota bacterium]|nr:M61 family metallopeptidase [Candidatus Eremiobacteraeota bacterium]
IDVRDAYVKASIILPSGWEYGTALPDAVRSGDRVDFGEVNLETLVDSPLDCGRYAKHISLWQGDNTQTVLDVFADAPQDLDIPDSILKPYKAVTAQALALYGARHWNVYHFLLTLSDTIQEEGIEHHQSSDNRDSADYMINADRQSVDGDLLTHEFSHSWNGKYRRPASLTTTNYQEPMKTDLLWVYEGMNQYLGELLALRSGIYDAKKYPDALAYHYAHLDMEPGRLTEPLIDTAVAAPYLYVYEGDYASIRRTSGDFYSEGSLLWLDVDTIIREQTHGQKSLDSFEQLFAGPPNTGPMVVTYTREQVEELLHQVAPYDWHAFFQTYVYEISPHPPTDEFARAGWRFVYTSEPNDYIKTAESVYKISNVWYSLGFDLNKDGAVTDVREGSPAWKAGLAIGAKVLAVDNQAYDEDVLKYALTKAEHSTSPITLLVSNNGWYSTHAMDYHDGPRYPHLERIKDKPDMLAAIAAPKH